LIDPSVSQSVIVGRPSPQELLGLDRATGAERWRRQLEDEDAIIPISSSGLLILLPAPSPGGQPQPTTMVTAIDAETGADRWQSDPMDFPAGDRSTIVADRVSDAGVVGLDRSTGTERWHRDDAAMSPGTDETVVGAGVVVLKLRAGAGIMIASLATGETIWQLDTKGSLDAHIVGGVLLHGAMDGQHSELEMFDAATGTPLGVVPLPTSERDQVSVPVVVADGVLYGGRGCPGRG
jgi:outer membrane protein assembly factor BamB